MITRKIPMSSNLYADETEALLAKQEREHWERLAREDTWLRENGHAKYADVGTYALKRKQIVQHRSPEYVLPDILDLLDINGTLRRP